jgi:hypothetical protein
MSISGSISLSIGIRVGSNVLQTPRVLSHMYCLQSLSRVHSEALYRCAKKMNVFGSTMREFVLRYAMINEMLEC